MATRIIDRRPIELVVKGYFGARSIQNIVDPWRIEPDVLVVRLTEHFRDLGIYFVEKGQEEMILENMIFQLKSAPDIQGLVAKNRADEQRRQQKRHAD